MKTSRFTDAQKAFIIRQGDEGTPVGDLPEGWYQSGDLLRRHDASEMKPLRELEDENNRLRRIVADLSLDKGMLQDIVRRKSEACTQTQAGERDARLGRCRSAVPAVFFDLRQRATGIDLVVAAKPFWKPASRRSVRPSSLRLSAR